MLVEECYTRPGTRAVCIREIQKTLSESSKLIVEDKIRSLGLSQYFNITKTEIGTPGGGKIIFTGMQDHTSESIKSLEGYRIAWVDEAQTLSERSLELLRPTIRDEGSELWFSWNPTRKKDAVDVLLRQNPPADAIVIKANWRDNPWFPETLEKERKLVLEKEPDRYGHIYEGEYASAFSGSYFSKLLTAAKAQRRITRIAADPILPLRVFVDIGGAGASADACAFWVCQFVDREVRVLDYLEGVGQVLGFYANELRSRGYQNAEIVLPHDGVNANNVTGKRYEDHWRDAGFDVRTIPNQGRGAASMRIEAVRRVLPMCWFNEETTQSGREALGYYHEKRDDQRNVGLGPDHDWSSHCADAFGLMAICYEEPRHPPKPHRYTQPGSWMG